MKCTDCGGEVEQKRIRYIDVGVDLGEFPVGMCTQCGEKYFSFEVAKKIQQKQKENGTWGLSSTTTVGQSGNALIIRLTKRLCEFMKLKKGQGVQIEPKGPGEFLVKVVKS